MEVAANAWLGAAKGGAPAVRAHVAVEAPRPAGLGGRQVIGLPRRDGARRGVRPLWRGDAAANVRPDADNPPTPHCSIGRRSARVDHHADLCIPNTCRQTRDLR